MGIEREWEVKRADQAEGKILRRDSSLHIDPTGATRPILLSRAAVTVAHVGVTADAPYGSLCTVSEHGLGKVWRILSDVELLADRYNAPPTTDLKYDFYMVPEQFEDFVGALGPRPLTSDGAGSGAAKPMTEYHATKHLGFFFTLLLICKIFGGILLLGSAVFLIAELFPEYEDDLVMVLVFLIPFASFGILWSILKGRRPDYRIQLSREQIVILRVGKPERIHIQLADSVALPVNWVASGRYGRRRAGPAYEFHHGNNQKTRIALSDQQDLWAGKVTEIDEPHFVLSRQAWDVLRSVLT